MVMALKWSIKQGGINKTKVKITGINLKTDGIKLFSVSLPHVKCKSILHLKNSGFNHQNFIH
jgi:hypothetical protein